jgi:hypothetical protein
MPKYCPNCGSKMSDNAQHCMGCGAKLSDYECKVSYHKTRFVGPPCSICGSTASGRCAFCKSYVCSKHIIRVQDVWVSFASTGRNHIPHGISIACEPCGQRMLREKSNKTEDYVYWRKV